MFYKRYTEKSDNPKWGGATVLFETDKANAPTRQLTVYENGKTFVYDKNTPADEGGRLYAQPLFTDKYGKKDWRKRAIRQSQFEKAWKDPSSVPADSHQLALRSVRTAASWTIALGIFTTLAAPLAAWYLIYHSSETDGAAVVVTAAVISAAIGLFFLVVGIKLRQTKISNLFLAKKYINIVNSTIIVIVLLNAISVIISGRGGGGLLLILQSLVIFFNFQAKAKIWQTT